jgi:hypothetical protein
MREGSPELGRRRSSPQPERARRTRRRAKAGPTRGRKGSVVPDLETIAFSRRKSVGRGTQSIFTLPVYLKV